MCAGLITHAFEGKGIVFFDLPGSFSVKQLIIGLVGRQELDKIQIQAKTVFDIVQKAPQTLATDTQLGQNRSRPDAESAATSVFVIPEGGRFAPSI